MVYTLKTSDNIKTRTKNNMYITSKIDNNENKKLK